MGDFDRHRDTVEEDDLVAPVELVGFARRKRQRYEGGGRRGGLAQTRHFVNRVARDPQLARDLLDRFTLDKMATPKPAGPLHNQYPRTSAYRFNAASFSGENVEAQFWKPIIPPAHARDS